MQSFCLQTHSSCTSNKKQWNLLYKYIIYGNKIKQQTVDTNSSWFASALGIAYILHACIHVWHALAVFDFALIAIHIEWFLFCFATKLLMHLFISLDVSCDHRKYFTICFVVRAENDMLAWIRILNLNERCWVLNGTFSHSVIHLLGRFSVVWVNEEAKKWRHQCVYCCCCCCCSMRYDQCDKNTKSNEFELIGRPVVEKPLNIMPANSSTHIDYRNA